MSKLKIADTFIYRYRYQLGYLVIGLVLAAALAIAGLYSPGGITADEQTAAIISGNLNLSSPDVLSVINLPYHLLQLASFSVFGVSQISIKLPSLLMALVAAFGMLLLLRRWFFENVAVLSAILVVTTGQFLFIAQNGTPTIMLVVWPIYILLLATLLVQTPKFQTLRQLLLAVVVATSLYTPLMPYILIAMVATCLLHPKLRYQIRHSLRLSWIAPSLLAIILIAPLGLGIYNQPEIGLKLLAIPSSSFDILANLKTLAHQYFDVFSPSSGRIMTPIYGLGALALMAIGLFKLIRSKYTIRSYTIVIWLVLLIPVIVLEPRYSSVTFVPLMLLLAIGIDTLIRSWYRLFPLNPYARLAGLVPLVVLVTTLTMTGVERYFYGYHYDPQTAKSFSRELRLVHSQIDPQNAPRNLVVTARERSFYETVLKYQPEPYRLSLVTAEQNMQLTDHLLTRAARDNVTTQIVPTKIVVDSRREVSDRLYVYKNPTN